MQVTLTPQAEEALRQQLAHSPGLQPEETVEEALKELRRRTEAPLATRSGSPGEDFRLRESRQGAERVPNLTNETFAREMAYQDQVLEPVYDGDQEGQGPEVDVDKTLFQLRCYQCRQTAPFLTLAHFGSHPNPLASQRGCADCP